MRLRISFSKLEPMRYIGHLDLHRTWERTFRRAGLPLAYSQGFHPQPRISLASALPLGFTSQEELVDVWLEEPLPLESVQAALEDAIPPGLKINTITEADLREPALQTQVQAAEFVATLLEANCDVATNVERLLEAETLPRTRRNKPYDLRPLVETLELLAPDQQRRLRLRMRLTAREGATGRPEEVLAELDIMPQSARVHRTRLILSE